MQCANSLTKEHHQLKNKRADIVFRNHFFLLASVSGSRTCFPSFPWSPLPSFPPHLAAAFFCLIFRPLRTQSEITHESCSAGIQAQMPSMTSPMESTLLRNASNYLLNNPKLRECDCISVYIFYLIFPSSESLGVISTQTPCRCWSKNSN